MDKRKLGKKLKLIRNDSWLEPYKEAIEGRYRHVVEKEKHLTNNGEQSLSDFASGYLYFGLHRTPDGWVLREWAPNATSIYLIGTFNHWQKEKKYAFTLINNGVWVINLPTETLHHADLYKLIIEWNGGSGERIPAWCRRIVQDRQSHIFSAQVWNPENPYTIKHRDFKPQTTDRKSVV